MLYLDYCIAWIWIYVAVLSIKLRLDLQDSRKKKELLDFSINTISFKSHFEVVILLNFIL